jgi:uncharacterized repeat protein (TIGR01451 family)
MKRSWIAAWRNVFPAAAHASGGQPRRRAAKRTLALETLEARALLAATDMASITGRIFKDATGDGYTAGEEVVAATVNLLLDDGDGVYEPGAGDTQVQTDATDSAGIYRFDGLVAGSYWVEQPAQTATGKTVAAQHSALIVVTPTDAMGVAGTTIDTFDTTAHTATAISTGPTTDADAAVTAVGEALGGERDLFASVTSGAGMVQLDADAFNQNLLEFMASATATGERRVTWDGVDSDGATLDATGLGGADLTDAGASTALQFVIGADQASGVAHVRLYSSAVNWSEATVAIPNTGGAATQTVTLPFSSFVTGGGSGVTLTNIGAIELLIEGVNAVDGQLDLFGAIGPTVETQNFDNFTPADLSITKSGTTATPTLGQQVTFTLTVNNAGPNAATGVTVLDQLPAGLTFVSSTPSQGTYSSGTGVWTVGTVANGGAATLQIVATAATVGAKVNIAQVNAANEFDPDSTPGNSAAGEDDQASFTVTPQSIDLSLTKNVDNATPEIGDNVIFTITVLNSGSIAATNVAVSDVLPSGLTFVSSTPTQGSINSGSGIWTVGGVANGASATLQITAQVANGGVKTNTAQVSAADQTDADSTPGNSAAGEDDQASITVTPQSSDLSLTKVADTATPQVGQNVTFTIMLANAGPTAATGVQVRDPLPSGLTFVSSTPSTGTYNSTTGIWTVGGVAVGANPTLQIVATVATAGAKTNTAQVSASDQTDIDSTPNNSNASEDDQASVTINPPVADLSLTKTVDNAGAGVGQLILFTVTVTNSGPSTAANVVVTDSLPSGLTYTSSTATQGTYNSSTGMWTIGSIASGGTATIQIAATVVTSGRKRNIAQITSTDQFDPDSTPGNSTDGEDDQAAVLITPPRRLIKRNFLAR